MSASASLIPELEDVIQHGSPDRRAKTVKRIANLFVDGARAFNEDHVGLFDDVLCRLVVEIEAKARAEMAQSLAAARQRADRADAHARARRRYRGRGPGASRSRRGFDESDLVELAKTKGQAHLAAIAGRADLGEAVTDVLVRRGDHRGGAQPSPTISPRSCPKAASPRWSSAPRATAIWPQKVGARPDIPPHLFRELLVRATAVVQQRLLASAKPETRAEIQRVLDKISREYDKSVPARDYAAAMRTVRGDASDQRARRGRACRISPRTRSSRRRSPRLPCCAACRSRPPTA